MTENEKEGAASGLSLHIDQIVQEVERKHSIRNPEPEIKPSSERKDPVQKLGRKSIEVVCPNCNYQGETVTRFKNGKTVWITFGILLALGMWLGCCLIPFKVKKMKDVAHYCGACNYYLGAKKRT